MDFQSSASCELKTLNSSELKWNFFHGHWTRQFVRYSIAPTIRHRDRVPSWTANAANTLSHSLSFYTLPPQGNRRLPFAICRLPFAICICEHFNCVTKIIMPTSYAERLRLRLPLSLRFRLQIQSPPSTQKNKRHWKNAKNLRSMQIQKAQSNANPQNQRIKYIYFFRFRG